MFDFAIVSIVCFKRVGEEDKLKSSTKTRSIPSSFTIKIKNKKC